ncbi:MAG: TIGR00730 family Rossman fold protein, partial [Patescibacteria group bacterium]
TLEEDQFRFLKKIEQEWTQAYLILNQMPSLTMTVYGGAKLSETDKAYKDTVEICKQLSKKGWGMVTGGGPGAMKAALVGGNDGGTPTTAFKIDLSREETKKVANEEYLFTNFPPRKHALRQSDVIMVVPGGWGTFDELFEVITLQKVEKLTIKPIILYDKEFWQPMMKWLKDHCLKRNLIRESEFNNIHIMDTVEEVVNYLSKES